MSLRVAGSEVFYSQLDDLKEITAITSFVTDLRGKLFYTDANRVINLLYPSEHITKALSNGFEMQSGHDIVFSSFINRKGERKGRDAVTFNFNVFRT